MTFAYPYLLFLYVIFALLVLYSIKWRRIPTLKVSSARNFRAAGATKLKVSLPFVLYALAVAIVIFALARPRIGREKIVLRAEGIDIMLAIDLSGSMRAIDVPDNIKNRRQLAEAMSKKELEPRIDVAKQEIEKFIEKRPNDRIGLIGFANLPYSACPPTLDHGWLIANLQRLEPGIIGDGTGIASPIASAVHRLENSESARRVLVLFTDGSNNVNARISPRQAAELAKGCNVIIYTVGIGSDRAYVLQNHPFFGSHFIPIGDQFDEKLLKDIASLSGGKYFRARDAAGLAEVMSQINKLEKTSVEQPKYLEYKEFAPQLSLLALIILLLAFALDHSVYLKVP